MNSTKRRRKSLPFFVIFKCVDEIDTKDDCDVMQSRAASGVSQMHARTNACSDARTLHATGTAFPSRNSLFGSSSRPRESLAGCRV